MEGLTFPVSAKGLLHFIFFESENYTPDIQKRYELTKEVIDKQGYGFSVYKLESDSKFKQTLELLVLGSYTSFYLAMLNDIDPAPIPWVDYFKERLG
jgi:glucose/mannose-6-phosphate isomerase